MADKKPLKVGVYALDKANFMLVVRCSDGTCYWPFPISDMLNGWPVARERGFLDYSNARTIVPERVEDAIRMFSITPTFLSRARNSSRHRVKWATKRKGGWGGRRKGTSKCPSKTL